VAYSDNLGVMAPRRASDYVVSTLHHFKHSHLSTCGRRVESVVVTGGRRFAVDDQLRFGRDEHRRRGGSSRGGHLRRAGQSSVFHLYHFQATAVAVESRRQAAQYARLTKHLRTGTPALHTSRRRIPVFYCIKFGFQFTSVFIIRILKRPPLSKIKIQLLATLLNAYKLRISSFLSGKKMKSGSNGVLQKSQCCNCLKTV